MGFNDSNHGDIFTFSSASSVFCFYNTYFYFVSSDPSASVTLWKNGKQYYNPKPMTNSIVLDGVNVYYTFWKLSGTRGTDAFGVNVYDIYGDPDKFFPEVLGMSTDIPADEYITIGGVSDIYGRDKSLDNIGVAVPGIAAGATDVPIDWGLVGDIAGTLTDVRAGVKDIADALAGAKVFPIDTTRDTVIDSDGDLSNDKAKDDVIPAVPDASLSDYKLAGLEKVFPFCIPFDLIAFLGCLSAAPEAPAFDWVFPLPGKDADVYTLHVDLSPWDPVAKIVRTMETLAFCVGLTMITREKMIMS